MFRPDVLKDRHFLLAVLQGGMLLVAFIAATAFNGTSDPLLTVFMPLLCILCGGLLWPGIGQGWKMPKSAVALTLVLFVGWLALSTLWSSIPYISHLFAFMIALLPMLFFASTMAQRPERTVRAFALAMALGWTGLALWALLQFYVFNGTAGKRIAGPMLDPNNMAALFNMGMIPAAALFLGAKTKARAAGTLVLYFLMATALMVTLSRAGLAIAILCLIILAVLERHHWLRVKWKLPVYLLTPVASYLLINYRTANRYDASFGDLAHASTSGSVIDRRALLEGGFSMLKAHPFGDIGLGNFYYYYPAFRSQKDMSDGFFVHNDPLQLTLETGVPAAILFYAFLVAVLVRMIRAWGRLPKESTERAILAGSFVALLSICIHSHINYNLYMPGILIPIGVLLTIWYRTTERAAGLATRIPVTIGKPAHRKIAAVLLALLVIQGATWSIRAGVTSHFLNRVDQLAQSDLEGAQHLAGQVARFGVHDNFSVYEAETRLALGEFNHAQQASAEERAEILKRGLTAIQTARRYNPAFTVYISLEAQIYYLGNGFAFPDGLKTAETLLLGGLASNPLSVDAREGLAVVYQAEGRLLDAIDVLNEGLKWPRPKGQSDIAYLMMLAKAHKDAGEDSDYQDVVNYAIRQAQSYGMVVTPP